MRERTRLVASVTRTAGGNLLLRAAVVLILGSVLLCAPAAPSDAADTNGSSMFVSESAPVKHVIVIVNKSRTINIERSFTRAIPGAADFADVLPLSGRSIYIQGKKVGTTNVSLVNADGQLVGVLDIQIALDTAE